MRARWIPCPSWWVALWLIAYSATAYAETDATGAGEDGFRYAQGRRDWSFPRDHGQHPGYKLEWWYYTGILDGPEGRRFGFQVTFFRRGIRAEPPARESAWAARSLYAGQAALSLLEGEGSPRFLHAGVSARESLALAGAEEGEHRVWVRAWRADPLPDDRHGAVLTIPAGEFTLSLTLRAEREPVLHGAGGLDRKGEPEGQASWYYSLTRLRAQGTVRIAEEGGAREVPVSGMAWMDHEFSSSQLGTEQAGWDWFGLRLSDGSDLMLYRLRRSDGSADPYSGGTWVSPSGEAVPIQLGPGALGPGAGSMMTPLDHWTSGVTGARYPVSWRIRLPEQALELELRPLAEAQELTPTRGIPFAYWEGAVRGSGTRAGQPVEAEGFLELTGYGGEVGVNLR